MRAHARAEGLSTGRWNGGSVAARERDGADRWGLPVSVPRERERGRGRGRAQRGYGPEAVGRSAAQFQSSPLRSVFFFFFCAVFA